MAPPGQFRVEAMLPALAPSYFLERDSAAFRALLAKTLKIGQLECAGVWREGASTYVRIITKPEFGSWASMLLSCAPSPPAAVAGASAGRCSWALLLTAPCPLPSLDPAGAQERGQPAAVVQPGVPRHHWWVLLRGWLSGRGGALATFSRSSHHPHPSNHPSTQQSTTPPTSPARPTPSLFAPRARSWGTSSTSA